MSYGNWKHILGVFSFQNSVSNGILVIKHTLRDPSVTLSFLFFFHFSFFLSLFFLYSSAQFVRSFFSFLFFFLPFCLSHLSSFFFFPFSSQTHLKKKKKSTMGATNWLLWVCEFSRCFKDANEFSGFVLQAQNWSGCCGYWGLKEKKRKKKRKKRKKERTELKNRERRETKRKKSGEDRKRKKKREGVTGGREKIYLTWHDCGTLSMCLITKMPLETEFWKLKIAKMCFQFP